MNYVYNINGNGFNSHPAGGIAAGQIMAERAITDGRFFSGYDNKGKIITMDSPLILENSGGKYVYTGNSTHSGNSHESCSQQPHTWAGETTDFTSLSPSGGCAKTTKRHVRYCATPPSSGVTSSMLDHPDGSFTITYYPGSSEYKPPGGSTTTPTTATTPSHRSCSNGSCPRTTPTTTITHSHRSYKPPTLTPPQSKKSPEHKNVAIIIFGHHATADIINKALTTGGYNKFNKTNHFLPKDLILDIQYTSDIGELRDFIRSTHKCDIIITYGTDANKVLPICRETDYDGSLLLIGGATSGVIDLDKSVHKTVSSVITTHGFGDNNSIISRDDHGDMVGVDSWVYVNKGDSLNSPASLIGNSNRYYKHSYLLEMVRALKIGHNGNNWKHILESKLYHDNQNVIHDYWS